MMKKVPFFALVALLFFATSCKNEAKTDANHESKVETPTKSTPAPLTEADIAKYTAHGKEIAQASFKALSGNLKKAMKKGGPSEAVEFCHSKASELVDSLKVAHHASIRRTSFKLRNQTNKATATEAAQLDTYEKDIAAGNPLKPQVMLTEDNKVQFFAPIKMKAVCLKCHGTEGKTMKAKDYMVIKKLYSKDEAIGYEEKQFRGIWSIQFDR